MGMNWGTCAASNGGEEAEANKALQSDVNCSSSAGAIDVQVVESHLDKICPFHRSSNQPDLAFVESVIVHGDQMLPVDVERGLVPKQTTLRWLVVLLVLI
jgi:hypothetical protein